MPQGEWSATQSLRSGGALCLATGERLEGVYWHTSHRASENAHKNQRYCRTALGGSSCFPVLYIHKANLARRTSYARMQGRQRLSEVQLVHLWRPLARER